MLSKESFLIAIKGIQQHRTFNEEMYALTGGAYGKYQRTRAAINRPFKYAKHPPTLMGCRISFMMMILLPTIFIALIIGLLL